MPKQDQGIFDLYFFVIVGSLAVLSVGFNLGWPSPSLAKLLADDSDVLVTPAEAGWIVSLMMVGWLFGSLLGSMLVDKIGRRSLLLLTSVPNLVGCIVIVIATRYWWFYLARLIIGLSAGMAMTVTPMYVGEIGEDRLQEILGAIFNNMMNLGILIVYCVGSWLNREALSGVAAALSVTFALMFVWMPESPYFLVMRKKREEARQSLMWLRGVDDVDEELKMVEKNVELQQMNAGSYKELVMTSVNRKALIIGVGIVVAQQLCGMGAVVAYSQLMFQESGAKLSSSLCIILVAIIQFITGLLSIIPAKLADQRTLLLLSTFGMVISNAGEALYFQLRHASVDVTAIFWLPVTAILGATVTYTIGLGVLTPVILSRIFAYNIKAKALMVVMSVSAVSMILITELYQIVSDTYGIQYSFWLFAGFSASAGIFVYFVIPEMKNKSMHDIQNILENTTQT